MYVHAVAFLVCRRIIPLLSGEGPAPEEVILAHV